MLSKQILLRGQGIFRSIEVDLAVLDNGEAFHAAWAKGQRMKMQDAIDYALALPGA